MNFDYLNNLIKNCELAKKARAIVPIKEFEFNALEYTNNMN